MNELESALKEVFESKYSSIDNAIARIANSMHCLVSDRVVVTCDTLECVHISWVDDDAGPIVRTSLESGDDGKSWMAQYIQIDGYDARRWQ